MLCTLLKSVTILKNLFGGLLEIFQNMDFNLHFRKIGRKKKVSIWKNDILIKGIAVGLDGNVQETISKIYD